MRIGVDIDNCLANFNDVLLQTYLAHDQAQGGPGIINPQAEYLRRGMFAWDAAAEQAFYTAVIESVAARLEPLSGAVATLQQLRADGHEIYLITGRDNGEYRDPVGLTKAWLRQYHFVYDHLIFTNAYDQHAKTVVCLNHHIDLMIDDSVNISRDLRAHGVKVYTMQTRYNQDQKDLDLVSGWREIYARITALPPVVPQPKIKVILDTDTNNECDDQFALAYLLCSQDKLDLQAVTIAPYHHDNRLAIAEGTDQSYAEVMKICDYLNYDATGKVFKGATAYLRHGAGADNPAVASIIALARQNAHTVILAIGALTNVALAIQKAPEIVDKMHVVWLGGHSFLSPDNQEFNFSQDVDAVQVVFDARVKLTLIPCKNVASNLRTSIYEVAHFLKGKSALGDYLCQRFYDDGSHGPQERRVIWDISAVAYLVNPAWFDTQEISCPRINADTSYQLTTDRHPITVVNYLDADKIFTDLFQKLVKKTFGKREFLELQ